MRRVDIGLLTNAEEIIFAFLLQCATEERECVDIDIDIDIVWILAC